MKHVGLVICAVLLIILGFIFRADQEIAMFLLIGKLPFVNLSLPPVAMIAIWICLVPLAIILFRGGGAFFWKLVEKIGELHQRQINRQIRLFAPKARTNFQNLLVMTLLNIETRPKKAKEPIVRRRFVALPT